MFTPHDTSVGGTVAPGLERVKEVFQRNFRSGDEISAQLCVVHRGEIVIVTNLKQAMQCYLITRIVLDCGPVGLGA